MTGRDELWRILFSRSAMSVEQAPALLARLQADALADEAEQASHGMRHLTVEHGDLESADDEQRLHQLWQWAHDNRARARIITRDSNDTTTWVIDGPDADALATDLEDLARRLDPGWWRIRTAAR
jgi:hypothetical protein